MTRLLQYLTPFTLLALLAAPAAQGQFSGNRALPIDEAFPFFVSIVDGSTLAVTFQPAAEHYLYQHRFGFSLRDAEGRPQALDFELPPGLEKTDQFFGDIVAYYDMVTATLDTDTDDMSGLTLVIEFQGCADWGLCYPPQSVDYPLVP